MKIATNVLPSNIKEQWSRIRKHTLSYQGATKSQVQGDSRGLVDAILKEKGKKAVRVNSLEIAELTGVSNERIIGEVIGIFEQEGKFWPDLIADYFDEKQGAIIPVLYLGIRELRHWAKTTEAWNEC
jgi:hypothetical protein